MRFILIISCFLFSPLALAQDETPPEAPAVEEAAPAAADEAASEKEEVAAPEADKSDEGASAEEAGEVAGTLADAIQDKNWALLFGLLLSMLVALANKFGLKDKVGGKAIPWVTSGLAVAGTLSVALVGGLPLMDALSQGLVAGVAAIGGWEMILKHMLNKKTEA